MIDQDTLKSIEDLHRLKSDGIITEEEFERSKQKLLFGGKPAAAGQGASNPITAVLGPAPTGLPAREDHLGWITLPLKRYADFAGRSTRKEFWMFQLIYIVLGFIGFAAVTSPSGSDGQGTPMALLVFGLVCIVLLGLVIPLLAVEARRLHDQNRSAWWLLMNLIPYVGAPIVFVMMLFEGTRGDNDYGPDPKAS